VNEKRDFSPEGRQIVDATLYLVLGTADERGRPWATPVYFAHRAYRELIWVSTPEARHSENLAARPDVSVVIFDSTAPINTGRAVYMAASAAEVTGDERAEILDVYSQRAVSHGGRAFAIADVEAPAHLRLYRAAATDQYALDEHDNRVPVSL
jgi:nitroimidazol reductase NimA-like FMN-containing flavoprotein (pyridoxamine 5'-phosphate oxidase superfamily)